MPSDRIRGLEEFHESYYVHSCTIHERNIDVLRSDIPSSVFLHKFKRWWHGLFLVSYTDERSRAYYTSSEAMRLDRVRQFRNFKGRIHPLSKFRNFWDLMMVMLFIFNGILAHHNTSIVHGQLSSSFYIFGPIIELFKIADIFVNIKTGYTDNDSRTVILEKHKGLLHYCSTKIFFHVASAIPLQWIMVLRYGSKVSCVLCKANLFILTLRLIGFFDLLRIYEYSKYMTRERNSFGLTFFCRFFRVFIMCFMTVLYMQDIFDRTLLMLMISEGHILDTSYVGEMIFHKYVNPDPPAAYTLYVFSFIRATNSLIRINFSMPKEYYLDRLVLIITSLIVHLFHLWCILEIYAFLNRRYFCEIQDFKVNAGASYFACCRQLPDKITKKIWKYHGSTHAHLKAVEVHSMLYKTLPQTMKNDIFLNSYSHYVKRIPYFSEWPLHIIQDIVLSLTVDIYMNNDLVAEPWVQSDGLTIVAMGELAVYTDGEERGHLIDGDFFGELSLVTDKEQRTSQVVAITFCVILLLDKILFRRCMRMYPQLFSALKKQLKAKFGQN